VRDKVKSRYQMRDRPQLDPAVEARLIARFDEDLQLLGAWIGESLSCENFNDAMYENRLR